MNLHWMLPVFCRHQEAVPAIAEVDTGGDAFFAIMRFPIGSRQKPQPASGFDSRHLLLGVTAYRYGPLALKPGGPVRRRLRSMTVVIR